MAFAQRRFLALAALVVALAGVNAFGRLGSETVTEWDESLYATSAAEMVNSGSWAATTFDGQLDYFNSKPPLSVWLIALSFKAFGKNLVAMRLPAAAAAVLTVVLLMVWLRRAYTDALALLAGLILSTSFAFFYVHSGRTANPDALFALLVLATVVTLWRAEVSPAVFPLIGVLVSAAFLVRGPGALLVVAIVIAGAWIRLRHVLTAGLVAGTATLSVVLIGAWAVARWTVDGMTFFRVMFTRDLVNRSLYSIEGHQGSILFYFDVLQRYQYEWIAAGVVALLVRRRLTFDWRQGLALRGTSLLLVVSGTILFVVPSLMNTKATWYANPLLPFLAVLVGAAILQTLQATAGLRKRVVIAMVVLATIVAESRIVWHSFNRRDLASSDQGLLLAHREALQGQRIHRGLSTRADTFVIEHLIGATMVDTPDVDHFLRSSSPGDFLLQPKRLEGALLTEVGNNGRYFLYRRP